jgi:hypothetical protein
MIFGNQHSDNVTFHLEAVSKEEDIIQMTAFVRAGFFSAQLPLFLTSSEAQQFQRDLAELHTTLQGKVVLRPEGQGDLLLALEASHTGHILFSGDVYIEPNRMNFRVKADQTYLPPLADFFGEALNKLAGVSLSLGD